MLDSNLSETNGEGFAGSDPKHPPQMKSDLRAGWRRFLSKLTESADQDLKQK
jgi:hypothetical protein